MADNVDFFSEERWQHSHQYQQIKFPSGDITQISEERFMEYERLTRRLYKEWLLQELEAWRKYWVQKLNEELRALIPNHSYKVDLSSFTKANRNPEGNSFTPKEGYEQSDILAHVITDCIYKLLHDRITKYGRIPSGGTVGNIGHKFGDSEVQLECDDWTYTLQGVILEAIESKTPSFEVEFMRKEGLMPKFTQHHWLRILGPDGFSFVTIDPWPDGGRNITPQRPRTPNGILFFGRNRTKYAERSGH